MNCATNGFTLRTEEIITSTIGITFYFLPVTVAVALGRTMERMLKLKKFYDNIIVHCNDYFGSPLLVHALPSSGLRCASVDGPTTGGTLRSRCSRPMHKIPELMVGTLF